MKHDNKPSSTLNSICSESEYIVKALQECRVLKPYLGVLIIRILLFRGLY